MGNPFVTALSSAVHALVHTAVHDWWIIAAAVVWRFGPRVVKHFVYMRQQ